MKSYLARRSSLIVPALSAAVAPLSILWTSALFGAATTSFNGLSSDNWNLSGNWTNNIPSPGDLAVLNSSRATIRILNGASNTASAGTLSITAQSTNQEYLTAGTLSTNVATLAIDGGATNGINLNMSNVPNGDFDYAIGQTLAAPGTVYVNLPGQTNITVAGSTGTLSLPQRLDLYGTVVGNGSIVFRSVNGDSGGLVLGRGDSDSLPETANTFSGGVRLVSGLLQIAENSHVDASGNITTGPLGTGTLTIEGGTIAGFKNGGGVDVDTRTIHNVVNVNANFATFDFINQVWNGTVNFDGTQRTVTVAIGASGTNNLHSLTLGGVLTGTAGFVKAGAGTMLIESDNSTTLGGAIQVSAGTLQIDSNGALGDAAGATSVASGATLRFNGIDYTSLEKVQIVGTGVSTGGAIQTADLTTNSFAGTIELTGNADLRVASGANAGTFTMTGTLALGAGGTPYTLTKTGPGWLRFNDTQFSAPGSGGALVMTAGTAEFSVGSGNSRTLNATIDSPTSTLTGTVIKNGSGTLQINRARVSQLNIDTGTLVVASNGTNAGTSRVGTLTIAGGSSPSAAIDLNDNDLILTATSRATVEGLIGYARDGTGSIGNWDRAGLTSTAARNEPNDNAGLGVLTGSEYSNVNSGTFDGFAVISTDVLVKYTYNGDTNFTGAVNFDDYIRIDIGFNTGLTGWVNGDFNYSGNVNFDDYVMTDIAFNTQSGVRGDPRERLIELGQMWHFRLEGYMEYFISGAAKVGLNYTVNDFYPDGRIPPPIPVPEPAALGAITIVAALTSLPRYRRRETVRGPRAFSGRRRRNLRTRSGSPA